MRALYCCGTHIDGNFDEDDASPLPNNYNDDEEPGSGAQARGTDGGTKKRERTRWMDG